MQYKMIVLDLDDTLLRDDQTISPRTKNALMMAQEIGVKVVLASGRPTFGMLPIASELQLEKFRSYILSYNGAKIIDCHTKEELYSNVLSPETAHRLYDLSAREEVAILTYVGNSIVTETPNKFSAIESQLTGLPVQQVSSFKEAVSDSVVKTLMLAEPERLIQVENKLQAELAGELCVLRSKPFFLEFTSLGVTKGASLDFLIKQLGIKQEEVISFGDSYNDLTMIDFAGLGVAMGNAPEDIKAKADLVTDTNMNDGVAQVVEEYVINKVSLV
ncbi:Cof-type HAD-IIB family hydrolase [Cytobacillus sp. Hm23]